MSPSGDLGALAPGVTARAFVPTGPPAGDRIPRFAVIAVGAPDNRDA
jgi:hypothetical protein